MDILAKTKTVLFEIYSKGENPSTDEEPNENSHVINIVEIIVKENECIKYIEFDKFIGIIDKVYIESTGVLKNFLIQNKSEEIYNQFIEIIDTRRFYEITEFMKTNDIILNGEINEKQILGKIISILFTKDYIKNYIPNPSEMMATQVNLTYKK